MPLVCLCLLVASLSTESYYDKGRSYAERLLVIEEQKKEIKKTIGLLKSEGKQNYTIAKRSSIQEKNGQCSSTEHINGDPETGLYIFVSFSMPDEAWISLSKEVVKVGGIFVLRGLPGNSFKQLAAKIHTLRKDGMHATIQIEPRLYKKFAVEKVPCFVSVDGDSYDKLSGNVTLSYALEKMKIKRELL